MRARSLWVATTFTVAILGTTQAWAANWRLIQHGEGRDVYVDTSSFLRSGSNVKVWTKGVFAQPQRSATNGRTYVVQLVHAAYACDRPVSAPLGYRLFSTLDQTVLVEEADFGDAPPGWDDVQPGTVYEHIRELGCKTGPSAK